jgi:alkanesulfonate monooxygenase
MSLHFHWFLPTNGDGRDIVGGGHGVATGSAGAVRPASLGYLPARPLAAPRTRARGRRP